MKKGLILVLLSLLCISCSVFRSTGDSIKRIDLGMSKSEVIKKMGKIYTIDEAYTDAAGNKVEVLGFKEDLPSTAKEVYQLQFVNNVLKEWHKIYLNQHSTEEKKP